MDVDLGETHFQTRRKDDFVHSFETLILDCNISFEEWNIVYEF